MNVETENGKDILDIVECIENEAAEYISDIKNARHSAEILYDAALFYKSYESGSDEMQVQGTDLASRFRHIRRRKLKKLKGALLDMDGDLYNELNKAKEEIGMRINMRAWPISDEDKDKLRRALSYKGLIEAINQALANIEGASGRSNLGPFYAAARPLLQHFTLVRGKVTTSVQEDISAEKRRPSDVDIKDKKGNTNVVRYSEAIIFLRDEFERLSGDDKIKHSLAKTVIEKWNKKKKYPEIKVTF